MRLLALVLAITCAMAMAGEKVIVIDPGHGGTADSGSQKERTLSSANNAASPAKRLEKDLSLELSVEVAKQLEALAGQHPGMTLKPLLTRTKDENPDFGKRAAFCATAKPAAIFSIHFNASDDHSALGTLAVIRHAETNPNFKADLAFATDLSKAAHAGVVKFIPRSTVKAPLQDGYLHGGAGSNFFYQLEQYPSLKAVPKCFLEIEFIDRKDVDEGLLARRKEAFPLIAKAIAEYLYTRFE